MCSCFIAHTYHRRVSDDEFFFHSVVCAPHTDSNNHRKIIAFFATLFVVVLGQIINHLNGVGTEMRMEQKANVTAKAWNCRSNARQCFVLFDLHLINCSSCRGGSWCCCMFGFGFVRTLIYKSKIHNGSILFRFNDSLNFQLEIKKIAHSLAPAHSIAMQFLFSKFFNFHFSVCLFMLWCADAAIWDAARQTGIERENAINWSEYGKRVRF